VLRGIFGPKRDEVIGGWRKLHNEELYNLCFSLNVIRTTKSRLIGEQGIVICMREEKCVEMFCRIS
jgi:hypothetical protein